jgi:DNA-binding response OmpR family regulator
MTMLHRRVLVIDDDRATTETFARMLRLEGHLVRTASNAEAGLALAYSYEPDAIIVDLRMPFLDGLGFVQRLRAQERDGRTPVAIVTGDYWVDDRLAGELHDLGVRIHLKPLWLDDLVKVANGLLKTPRNIGQTGPALVSH